jgi:hypothetical protein
LDVIEIQRSYPELNQVYQSFVHKLGLQLEKRIEFNQKRGILNPNISQHIYHQIAQLMVLTINSWLAQQAILNISCPQEATFKETVWLHLLPYLTEKGQAEFHALIAPLLS